MAGLNVHGGDIYSYIFKNGGKPLDYSANINPLGLPEAVKKVLTEDINSICAYPDSECRILRDAVSKFDNIPKDFLSFGNGAADLIYRICYGLRPEKALIPAPTFAEYEHALNCVDCDIEYHYLRSKEHFLLDEKILEDIEAKDILFLCNPNNPTGKLIEPRLIKLIADKCKSEKCILVIDECFLGFVEEEESYSFRKYLSQYDNVIILKAFTKLFSMPGIRLGYCICSNAEILEKIDRAGQTWSVSVLAQMAGAASLTEAGFVERTRELISNERDYLTGEIREMGIKVFESNTNFILLKTDTEKLYEKLYTNGILIRRCENFIGLDSDYYRIAVKSHSNNERFISVLKEVLQNG